MMRSSEGVAVWAPEVPGCASQGNTEAEALENMRDALENHLEVLAETKKIN